MLADAPIDPERPVMPSVPTRCPIPRTEVHEFFQGINTPARSFDFNDEAGAPFRQLLARLPPPTAAASALTSAPSTDEVADAVHHADATSSPGIDGVGYDIYKKFLPELLPVLHAAFTVCWSHGKVPAVWKVGTVQLIYKKGDSRQTSNWRPICLQACIYKLYSGMLARRLISWLEANKCLADAQKGFRSTDG